MIRIYGNDPRKIEAAYQQIQDEPLPPALVADTFVIGTSGSGRLGTYHVDKIIQR